MSEKPDTQEILSAVMASGYLMEQEVATLLETEGFVVTTNRAYTDADESKSREIDVLAMQRAYRNNDGSLEIIVELICECKNNQQPFVFISRRKNQFDKRRIPEEYVFPVQSYVTPSPDIPNAVRLIPAFFHLGLDQWHYEFLDDMKVVQFCRILRKGKEWEASHDDSYISIFYPIVKALKARQDETKPSNVVDVSNPPKRVRLFFPTVVLNSEIYLIDSSSAKPEPRLVDHVTFVREIRSPQITGKYTVEFVTRSGLLSLTRTKIRKFTDRLVKLAETDPAILLNKDATL